MYETSKILDVIDEECKMVFKLLEKKGPLTKNQLSVMTKIPLSTLNRIIQPLEQNMLIVKSNIGESTGGRKPALYDVNPGRYFIVGIDISRTYTEIVAVDLKMDILDRRYFTMDESCTPERTVEKISDYLKSMVMNKNLEGRVLLGVGAGVVGPLNIKSGSITNSRHFDAPGWTNVHIRKMLEDKLETRIVIDNGANAAVFGEYFYGNGKGFENIAYFNCGVGIRTGAIASGNLIRCINNVEDSFGHMVIDVDGELCDCGNYGCIECYSSIHSITRKFLSSLKKGRSTIIAKPIDEINYTDICDAAEHGDELSREIITNSAVIFGTGLANYINLINPGLIILSGPLIKNSKLFYEVCTTVASKKYYSREEYKVVFNRGGHFCDNEIAVGAAVMSIE